MKKVKNIETKKIFKSTTNALSEVRQFVDENAINFGFDEKEVSEIILAVDEACTNVIKHAYKGDPNYEFEVRIVAGGTEFQIVVRDWGAGFKPEEVPVPNIREKAGRHKAGGLGIFLMRKLMDTVEYQGREAANEVRLIRYLKSGPNA